MVRKDGHSSSITKGHQLWCDTCYSGDDGLSSRECACQDPLPISRLAKAEVGRPDEADDVHVSDYRRKCVDAGGGYAWKPYGLSSDLITIRSGIFRQLVKMLFMSLRFRVFEAYSMDRSARFGRGLVCSLISSIQRCIRGR